MSEGLSSVKQASCVSFCCACTRLADGGPHLEYCRLLFCFIEYLYRRGCSLFEFNLAFGIDVIGTVAYARQVFSAANRAVAPYGPLLSQPFTFIHSCRRSR